MTLSFSWSTLPAPIYGALIGGLVGSGLNAIFTHWREGQVSGKKARAVRTLIACEVAHNLRLLSSFWSRWETAAVKQREADEEYFGTSPLFSVPPLPTWKQQAFISQMAVLPVALPEDLASVYEFHSQLDRLQTLYVEIVSLEKERRPRDAKVIEVSDPIGSITAMNMVARSKVYQETSSKLQAELKEVVEQVQNAGNPLR